MSAIATAVDVGDLVFISGILNDGGLGPVGVDADEFSIQARGCFLTIKSDLEQLHLTLAHVVHQDNYIDEGCSYADLVALPEPGELLSANAARAGARLPFGGADLIEVTTIATKHDVDVLDEPNGANIGATVRTNGFCFRTRHYVQRHPLARIKVVHRGGTNRANFRHLSY